MDVPKWQLLGAMFGVPYIVIMVLAVQRIGAAVATVAVIFGQLTMSMLIDNFGWLGNASIPFSLSRIGAIVCLGIALFFIYSSSRAKAATAKIPASHRRGADDYSQRFSSRLALTPPKPKPFDSA